MAAPDRIIPLACFQPPPDIAGACRCGSRARQLSAHLCAVVPAKLLRQASDRSQASPGILLQANDAPAGTTPKVFLLQVKTRRDGRRGPGRHWQRDEDDGVTAHLYHQKLARGLDRMGGLYTLNDILTAIAEGRMQSFVEGNSWAITQVVSFPRAKVLEVFAAVGDLDDLRILHDRIIDFAAEDRHWRNPGLWPQGLASRRLRAGAGR